MMAQKKHLALLLLAGFSMLFGCKSAEQKNTAVETTAYVALAEKLGGQVKYDFNKDRTYVLAQSKPAANAKQLGIAYFVFDMKTEEVVLRGNLDSGFVQWLSEHEIEVFRTPGKMAPNTTQDDYTDVFNVKTGESTPKPEWKK